MRASIPANVSRLICNAVVVRAVVWYASWQMECCGDPFAVGDRVTWSVEAYIDDDWFSAALGPEMATRITHSEEHHSEDADDLTEISGRVLTIVGAWGAYGPLNAGDRIHVPLPDSARFVDVRETLGLERQVSPELTFNGWIVELALDD